VMMFMSFSSGGYMAVPVQYDLPLYTGQEE
jgi:hypothetical protein